MSFKHIGAAAIRLNEQTRLWWVRQVDQSGGHLFAGELLAMVAHINALHVSTGRQHAAREID